jgi:uncharacterized protein YabE (DUF348 family)
MKTQNLIIGMFLVVFLSAGINFSASAQNNYKGNKVKTFVISLFEKNNKVESVETQIQEMLHYPEVEIAPKDDVKVRLVFQITTENKIKVIAAFSENKVYRDYLTKTIDGQNVEVSSENPDENIAIDVYFRFVD